MSQSTEDASDDEQGLILTAPDKRNEAKEDKFTKTARSHKRFCLISHTTLLLLLKFQKNRNQ